MTLITTIGSPSTDTVVDTTFSFTHALEADDIRLHYSTDFPKGTGGQAIAIDINRDGNINRDPVARELIAYEDLTTPDSSCTTDGVIPCPQRNLGGIYAGLIGNPKILNTNGFNGLFGPVCVGTCIGGG